jgi:hypothetical protein
MDAPKTKKVWKGMKTMALDEVMMVEGRMAFNLFWHPSAKKCSKPFLATWAFPPSRS